MWSDRSSRLNLIIFLHKMNTCNILKNSLIWIQYMHILWPLDCSLYQYVIQLFPFYIIFILSRKIIMLSRLQYDNNWTQQNSLCQSMICTCSCSISRQAKLSPHTVDFKKNLFLSLNSFRNFQPCINNKFRVDKNIMQVC